MVNTFPEKKQIFGIQKWISSKKYHKASVEKIFQEIYLQNAIKFHKIKI